MSQNCGEGSRAVGAVRDDSISVRALTDLRDALSDHREFLGEDD
jgi:hypothetical protein